MMSPLEYLFVMMMKTGHPDAEALNRVEPASGEVQADTRAMVVNKSGRVEMRTILMEPRDSASEKFELPMRITADWEPLFKIGAPVAVVMDKSGKHYPAHISRIETIRDENGQSIQAIAQMAGADAALQPGMMATATLTTTALP